MFLTLPFQQAKKKPDSPGLYDTAAEKMGKIFVSTELWSGGSPTAYSIGIAKRGLCNFLIHANILYESPTFDPSLELNMLDFSCVSFANCTGLFEPTLELGESIQKDQLMTRIWLSEHTGRSPENCFAKKSGLLIG